MATARSSNLVALPITVIPHSSSPSSSSSSSSPSPTSPPSPPPQLSVVFSAWLESDGRSSRIHLFVLHSRALYKSSEAVADLLRLNGRAGSSSETAFCNAVNHIWKDDSRVSSARTHPLRQRCHHCHSRMPTRCTSG